MKALIFTGMQVDLMPLGAVEVPGGEELVPLVNRLIPQFDCVVAANFSLPADHVIFAANHPWRRPGQVIEIEERPTLLYTFFCIPGSFGAELAPGLHTDSIHFTVEMGTNGKTAPQSAFFDFGKVRDTGLSTYLKTHNIEDIYLAGMPLEQIRYSALDGIAEGFNVFIIKDAIRGWETEFEELDEDKLSREAGIQFVHSLI